MSSTITKEQAIEILKYFDDKSLPKPKWYEEMEFPKFVIDPNDFDEKEIEDYCSLDFYDPNFITFEGFSKLFIKHKSHTKWYCYHFCNTWDSALSISYNPIQTENEGEYIIFVDSELPKLVREYSVE